MLLIGNHYQHHLKNKTFMNNEIVYDLVAQLSYGGFLSDRIKFEDAEKKINALLSELIAERNKVLVEMLGKIDTEAMMLEDVLHGIEGGRITLIRGMIEQALKQFRQQ